MPLVARDNGQGHRPVIVCDACGKDITRASDCSCVWFDQDGLSVLRFLHSSARCAHVFEQHEEQVLPSNLSLIDILGDLGSSMAIDWDAVIARTAVIKRSLDSAHDDEEG